MNSNKLRRVFHGSFFPYLLFAVLTVIWGSNFILMKKAGMAFGPIMISFSRVFLGACVLWGMVFATKIKWQFETRDFIALLIPVLVGAVLPYSILPWLIDRNGSGLIGMMIGLVPIMTVIVSIPILNQWPGTLKVIGVTGGFIFLIVLMGESIRHKAQLTDMILASLVPLCYAVANTYIKKRFKETPPLLLSCTVLTMSAFILFPLVFVLPWPVMKDEANANLLTAIIALFANGFLATGFATFGFYYLISKRGPLFAGLVAYLIPFGAIIWGWLDGETVTKIQIISICGILAMVAFIECGAKEEKISN